jgi:transcriptional antiterminator NusG
VKSRVAEGGPFEPGQQVHIVSGPFHEFTGTIYEIDVDRQKVRLLVSFMWRETPVDLDYDQIEKM